jgi:hypothetical protein
MSGANAVSVHRLVRARDEAIRRLWCAFRDLSDELPEDDWSEADLDLWGRVTTHTAVQSRLESANEEIEVRNEQSE